MEDNCNVRITNAGTSGIPLDIDRQTDIHFELGKGVGDVGALDIGALEFVEAITYGYK